MKNGKKIQRVADILGVSIKKAPPHIDLYLTPEGAVFDPYDDLTIILQLIAKLNLAVVSLPGNYFPGQVIQVLDVNGEGYEHKLKEGEDISKRVAKMVIKTALTSQGFIRRSV